MSKIFTCVVIDDSLIERDLLICKLQKFQNVEICAVFGDGLKALTYLSENEVDIVISDIEMPFLRGIDLIKVLKTSPAFIFVTSHSCFAVEGFELNAVDYIVKPVSNLRLEKAIKKAIINIQKSTIEVIEAVNSHDLIQDDHFYIRENNGITKLKYKDVLYVESLSDFSKIYTSDKVHIVLANLKSLESQLPKILFKRIHKQFIINIYKIFSINLHDVYLEGEKIIPMGNTYKQELMHSINSKIISRN